MKLWKEEPVNPPRYESRQSWQSPEKSPKPTTLASAVRFAPAKSLLIAHSACQGSSPCFAQTADSERTTSRLRLTIVRSRQKQLIRCERSSSGKGRHICPTKSWLNERASWLLACVSALSRIVLPIHRLAASTSRSPQKVGPMLLSYHCD